MKNVNWKIPIILVSICSFIKIGWSENLCLEQNKISIGTFAPETMLDSTYQISLDDVPANSDTTVTRNFYSQGVLTHFITGEDSVYITYETNKIILWSPEDTDTIVITRDSKGLLESMSLPPIFDDTLTLKFTHNDSEFIQKAFHADGKIQSIDSTIYIGDSAFNTLILYDYDIFGSPDFVHTSHRICLSEPDLCKCSLDDSSEFDEFYYFTGVNLDSSYNSTSGTKTIYFWNDSPSPIKPISHSKKYYRIMPGERAFTISGKAVRGRKGRYLIFK